MRSIILFAVLALGAGVMVPRYAMQIGAGPVPAAPRQARLLPLRPQLPPQPPIRVRSSCPATPEVISRSTAGSTAAG